MFGLENPLDSPSSPPPFFTKRSLLLANARSGIRLVVEMLLAPTVWVPSYLCACIIEAIKGTKAKIKFYEVDDSLALSSREWLDEVQRGDLVLVIDFFGFPFDNDCAMRAQERGAWVLDDACQALLTETTGRVADFILFSPRKFLAVPDGAILNIKTEHHFELISLRRSPAEWWLKAWVATLLRREFDLHGTGRRWFELFREVETEAPIGSYAMSELSHLLLQKGVAYATVAQRRAANYRSLGKALEAMALFPALATGVVPLGFPIRVRNRDALRKKLFDQEIYPPVHWPLEGLVPGDFERSHLLSREIMTLPCDQRYDEGEMNRVAQLILNEAH